jgi:hypothetical protein
VKIECVVICVLLYFVILCHFWLAVGGGRGPLDWLTGKGIQRKEKASQDRIIVVCNVNDSNLDLDLDIFIC